MGKRKVSKEKGEQVEEGQEERRVHIAGHLWREREVQRCAAGEVGRWRGEEV